MREVSALFTHRLVEPTNDRCRTAEGPEHSFLSHYCCVFVVVVRFGIVVLFINP